ncbi:hypothetical protein HNR00_002300 [Methylorubrum rhodinum]|jgi:hypothetical protein|uniref:DUF6894 domain-containing protein n=1 Tax=Methylorubrum rhodinum TaxID=29428 RepID=A0A840ZJ44_9HYPH|nr:hypothetical protein [Methylorubrum rhodinum]MBB5757586.1 hypothetical protein [Methylorubrum rhodinum]
MPLYFFDLHDGATFVKDEEGFDLPDPEAVRERLARIMTRVVRGVTATADRQDFFAIARDAQGRVLFRAHLSLDMEAVESA